MSEQLTEQQIANWRLVLVQMLGPAGLYLSREDIQAYRDRFQALAQEQTE